jgi:hypothetical protein
MKQHLYRYLKGNTYKVLEQGILTFLLNALTSYTIWNKSNWLKTQFLEFHTTVDSYYSGFIQYDVDIDTLSRTLIFKALLRFTSRGNQKQTVERSHQNSKLGQDSCCKGHQNKTRPMNLYH